MRKALGRREGFGFCLMEGGTGIGGWRMGLGSTTSPRKYRCPSWRGGGDVDGQGELQGVKA